MTGDQSIPPADDRPRISLVVPAFDEERLLPALLDSIVEARRHFAGTVEVVVADNGSRDRTAEIARTSGALVVQVAPRLIAAVRNGGARAARGELLAFIDADSTIHPRSLVAIDRALRDPQQVGGTTGVTFDRRSWGITAAQLLFEPMSWATRMRPGIYFCRREDFWAIGGYDERLSFAEDVKLLVDLRRLGRTRGQRLSAPRGVRAVTSARKFERHGDFHWLWLFLRGGWSLATGRPPSRALRDYWYPERRREG
jgi:glycosyltransferase involved in cell wall biosynthesis